MSRFGFDKVRKNLEVTKRRLPILLAKQAEEHFVQSFDTSSWEGAKWQEPQRRIPGTTAYMYPLKKGLSRRTKPTLTLTGKLRRATAKSTRTATWNLIRLSVELPYAEAHNTGGQITVGAHTRTAYHNRIVKESVGYKKNKKGQLKEVFKKHKISITGRQYQHGGAVVSMPKRQFMGDGPRLRRKQNTLINREIGKIWV